MESLKTAIEKGIQDFSTNPEAYGSLEEAIRYRIADYIWIESKKYQIDDPFKVLSLLQTITK